MKYSFIIFLIPILALGQIAPTGRLPSTNTVPYANFVGVEGGIPSVTAVYTNLSPSGNNDMAQINAALALCPSNKTVNLSSGRFILGMATNRNFDSVYGPLPLNQSSTYPIATPFKMAVSETFYSVGMPLSLSGAGTPSGNLTIVLYSDNAGSPSASVLGASTLLAASGNVTQIEPNTTLTWFNLTNNNGLTLSQGTVFWVAIYASSTSSPYINIHLDATAGNVGGNATVQNNGSWSAISGYLTMVGFGTRDQISIVNSGVVLNGAGSNTLLDFNGSSPPTSLVIMGNPTTFDNVYNSIIYPGSAFYGYAGIANWTSGYAQGSSNLTLSTTSWIQTNMIVCLDQINNNVDVQSTGFEGLCTYCGRTNGVYSQQEWRKVVGINGNNITVWPPIFMPNWNQWGTNAPQCFGSTNYTYKVGLQNLSISGTNTGPYGTYGGNIAFTACYDGWVSNVWSYVPAVEHIMDFGGARNTIQHCYFAGTQAGAELSYGYLPEFCSCDLVFDNIFNGVPSTMILSACASGNVMAYNCATNEYYPIATNWQGECFASHDTYTCMNLYEGNVGSMYYGDFIHGSGGYNSLFRNFLLGYESAPNPKTENTYCVYLSLTNWYFSSIGNILGTVGIHTNLLGCPTNSNTGYNLIYCVGIQNTGYTQEWGSDYGTWNTFYIHGDYNTVTTSTLWNTTNTHTLPNSLVFTSKPSNWGNLPWPSYDQSNGAAQAGNFNYATNIAAGYRLYYGSDPSGGGGGGGTTNSGTWNTTNLFINTLRIGG